MTTTNLRDGLEVLYYFGEQYFDPQRNQLQDHSGYGRHGKAQGSITFGNEGPNDFDAAAFSGGSSGDKVTARNLSLPRDEFTVLYIGKVQPGAFGIFSASNPSFTHSAYAPNGYLTWGLWEGFNRVDRGLPYDSFNQFALNGLRFHKENDYVDIIHDADIVRRVSISNGTVDAETNVVRFGKNKVGPSGDFSGDLALAGIWNRGITDRELDRLNDLTGKMRAQL